MRDEPFEFVLGGGSVIPAFDEAVATMRVGGYRRVEVPGERPELGYPIDRAQRFTGDVFDSEHRIYRRDRFPRPSRMCAGW